MTNHKNIGDVCIINIIDYLTRLEEMYRSAKT